MPNPNPEKLISRSDALREVGFWQNIDYVAIFVIATNLLALIVSAVIGHLTIIAALTWLVAILLLVSVWVVLLVFRCMWFVIQITAEIKMMPAAASQMVMAFMRGGGK